MKKIIKAMSVILTFLIILSMPAWPSTVTALDSPLIIPAGSFAFRKPAAGELTGARPPVMATDVVIGKKETVKVAAARAPRLPAKASTGIVGAPCTGTRYAIVYGINDYYGTANDLNGCVNDATLVKNVLINDYGFAASNIDFWTNKTVSRQFVFDDIRAMKARLGPDDELFFFFSGHGSKGRAADYDNNLVDQAIVVWNNALNGYDFIWDGELQAEFADFATDRIIFAFDSCYSGGMTVLGGAGRVVNMACEASKLSYELAFGSTVYGRFTYYFALEGIKNQLADVPNSTSPATPVITIEEAYDYARAKCSASKQPTVINDQFANDLLP